MKISVLKSRLSLSFRRAALIEADAHYAAQIRSYVEDIGLQQLESCCDLDAFMDKGQNTYDLIILDWNAKDNYSGLITFNRLRQDPKFSGLPILVISGFVDRNDFRLLDEFPLTRLVEKPFTAGVFIEAVQSLQQELNWVREQEKPLQKILQGTVPRGAPRLKKMRSLLQNAPYPTPLLLMFGRYLSLEKCWDEARSLLQGIVRKDRSNVLALNELGKVLHATGQHREAIRVLAEADALSPENLKRICHIGELHLQQCQLEEARTKFERVLTLDAKWERARQGHDLTMNALDYLQKMSNSGSLPQSFASLMNTIGIAKVHGGKLQDGIHHYESALNFIRETDMRAKVMFNMGLGYLRYRKDDQALLWFMRSAQAGGQLFAKARPYIEELSLPTGGAEESMRIQAPETIHGDAQDHVSKKDDVESREPESIISLSEPIAFLAGDFSIPAARDKEAFDTNALLRGIVEEGLSRYRE